MSLPLAVLPDVRDEIYDELMANAIGHENDEVLAQIVSSWASGGGALPAWLGMSQAAFFALCDFHFKGCQAVNPHAAPCDFSRAPERDDLHDLIYQHRAQGYEGEEWIADILVAACMGSDHLWQDLGVWSRKELSALMENNFPRLAAKNTKDMKWKKFLYKQLCAQEGIYVCRAPTCEVCVDYAKCFGPEE